MKSWPTRFAALLGVNALTVAQPVLALTIDSPEFFTLRKPPDIAVVAFAIWLVMGIPALVLAGERAAEAMRNGSGWTVHLIALCVYLAVLALMILERADTSLSLRVGVDTPGWALIAVALAVAAILVRALKDSPAAHAYVAVLSLAAPVVMILFLLRAPIGGAQIPDSVRAARPAPIVLVVFDEFPTASLLGAAGHIDRKRMPAFTRLAETSYWFSSATTVADETFRAVPAILGGRRASPKDRPDLRDWPRNLFTMLRGQYEERSLEPATRLCPDTACGRRGPGALHATRSLLKDSGRLAARAVAPPDLDKHFPPVLGEQGTLDDPSAEVERFLVALRLQERPSLVVMHIMLPHHPWRYLPSGRRYSAPGEGALPRGFTLPLWTTRARVVKNNWRRHLLQAGYADAVLGRILDRLRRMGTFNRSLVIVTADHGISFEPGREMRHATRANLGAIASVPLFVKRPSQRRGARISGTAETSDILPTVLDVVAAGPAEVRRRSLLNGARRSSPVAILSTYGPTVRRPLASVLEQRRAVLRDQAALLKSPDRAR